MNTVDPPVINCSICSQVFSSRTKLFKHLECHGIIGSNPYEKIVLLIGWLAIDSQPLVSDYEDEKYIKDGTLKALWTSSSCSIEASLSAAIEAVDSETVNNGCNIDTQSNTETSEYLRNLTRSSSCAQVIFHSI
jgi:hypothetical protein